MAMVEITCTCATCGKDFLHRKKLYNRREADKYEEWAKYNVDECPDCYRERIREKRNSEPMIINLEILNYVNKANGNIQVKLYITGGSYPHKDKLKEAGYKFDGLHWYEVVQYNENNVNHAIQKAEDLGAKFIKKEENGQVSSVSTYALKDAQHEHIKWKRKKELLSLIKPPDIPEILKDRRWNGKFYGKDNNVVYLGNQKITLYDDTVSELTKYLEEKKQYNKNFDQVDYVVENDHLYEKMKERLLKNRTER